jgi:SAM-dependent methyltransferase
MNANKEVIKDIIVWDVVNWSKAINFWERNASVSNKDYNCLELGSSRGGMSLWLALSGNNVLCTDLNGPEEDARHIHSKYNCSSRISYDSLDVTKMPFENQYDVIIFKSIIGGICGSTKIDKATILNKIHKALKPGGKLLFAENLESTLLHKALRKKYGTKDWDFLKIDEINQVFSSYRKLDYTTVGFFGCMGRNEPQRNLLGKIDNMLSWAIPDKSKYILIGIAEK